MANYTKTAAAMKDGWIYQLSRFTKDLVATCHELTNKPVAVSPYFNGKLKDRPDLVAADIMGLQYARYLKDTGISVVMLQDGVGVGRVPSGDVAAYVGPYLRSVKNACDDASASGQAIECWLNVESIGADIGRLKVQMKVGGGHAKRIVTFDFPHHLNKTPLYDDYLEYISKMSKLEKKK